MSLKLEYFDMRKNNKMTLNKTETTNSYELSMQIFPELKIKSKSHGGLVGLIVNFLANKFEGQGIETRRQLEKSSNERQSDVQEEKDETNLETNKKGMLARLTTMEA